MKAPSFLDFLSMLGVVLTPGQRVAAAVMFDRVPIASLEGRDADIAHEFFGPVGEIPASAFEVAVLVKGARIGGSYIFGALRALHLSCTVSLATLAPGEVASTIIVAPDLRLARQTLRYAIGAAKASRVIRVTDETKDSFTIKRPDGNVTLECLPASRGGKTLRGRSLVAVVLSEAAFFLGEDFVVNDLEIFKAVAPRVMPGGQIVIESTPWLESGLLFDFWKSDYGDPKSAIVAFCPTRLMRDDERTLALVDREEARDPDNAEREFGAQFASGGTSSFFDAAAVDACVVPDAFPIEPRDDESTHAGGDFAFRSDSSAIVFTAWREDVLVVLAVSEKRPKKGEPLKPGEVVDAFAADMNAYGAEALAVDGHYVESVREHLDRNRLRLVSAPEGATGKAVTYLALRKLINERRIQLPLHPRLRAQLVQVVSKPVDGGGIRISTPRRKGAGHGDLVSALVLSAWDAGAGGAAPKRASTKSYGSMEARQ
jgi:hypothetical protein